MVEAQRAAGAHIGQRLRVQGKATGRAGAGAGQPNVAVPVQQPQRAVGAHRHRLCYPDGRREASRAAATHRG